MLKLLGDPTSSPDYLGAVLRLQRIRLRRLPAKPEPARGVHGQRDPCVPARSVHVAADRGHPDPPGDAGDARKLVGHSAPFKSTLCCQGELLVVTQPLKRLGPV
jgi:hypothetical protein